MKGYKLLAIIVVALVIAAVSLALRSHAPTETNNPVSTNQQQQASLAENPAKPTKKRPIPSPWPNGNSPFMEIEPAPYHKRKGFTPVEMTGDDLSKTSTDELISYLNAPPNHKDHQAKRVAWELGNRRINTSWKPSPDQQKSIRLIVSQLVNQQNLEDSATAVHCRDQLVRLWSLTHPTLVESLDPNRDYLDIIFKTLVTTRSRSLIENLIQEFHGESDPRRKQLIAFTLSCMKERRYAHIPEREIMTETESAAIYQTLIAPAIH